MERCDYCGESVNALKNHVRLSSGGGHGPSGQYPADFNQGGETPTSTDASAQEDAQAPATDEGDTTSSSTPSEHASGGRDDVVEMKPEEMDRVVEAAVGVGREQASTTATQSAPTTEQPATVESNDNADDHPPEVREGCPECGGELMDFRETPARVTGGMEIPTPDDYYCSECQQGFNAD